MALKAETKRGRERGGESERGKEDRVDQLQQIDTAQGQGVAADDDDPKS